MLELFLLTVIGMSISYVLRYLLISGDKFPTKSKFFPNAIWFYILFVVLAFLVDKTNAEVHYKIGLMIGFVYYQLPSEEPTDFIAEDFFHPQATLNYIFHKFLDILLRLALAILGIFSGVALGKII